MSYEAPKKIWTHRNGRWGKRGSLIQDEKFTQYVRADLVDGLVESLKEAAELFESASEGVGVNFYQCAKDARAALSRLKEEG